MLRSVVALSALALWRTTSGADCVNADLADLNKLSFKVETQVGSCNSNAKSGGNIRIEPIYEVGIERWIGPAIPLSCAGSKANGNTDVFKAATEGDYEITSFGYCIDSNDAWMSNPLELQVYRASAPVQTFTFTGSAPDSRHGCPAFTLSLEAHEGEECYWFNVNNGEMYQTDEATAKRGASISKPSEEVGCYQFNDKGSCDESSQCRWEEECNGNPAHCVCDCILRAYSFSGFMIETNIYWKLIEIL